MKRLFRKLVLIGILLPSASFISVAQKSRIDSDIYVSSVSQRPDAINWESVDNAVVSDNGKYLKYTHKLGRADEETILCSTDSKWQLALKKTNFLTFNHCNTKAYLRLPGDTLVIVTLGAGKVEFREHENCQQVLTDNGDKVLLMTVPANHQAKILWNIETGKKKYFEHFILANEGKNGLNILYESSKDDVKMLQWGAPGIDTAITVCPLPKATDFFFSSQGDAIAFKVMEDNKTSCWYFKKGMSSAVRMIDDDQLYSEYHVRIEGLVGMSKDGQRLLMTIVRTTPLTDHNKPIVKIWSFADKLLPTYQDHKLPNDIYYAQITISDRKFVQLTYPNEINWRSSFGDSDEGNFALIDYRFGNGDSNEWHWNQAGIGIEYLWSAYTGTRTVISKLRGNDQQQFRIDPTGKFVIYFDRRSDNFYSYEIGSKTNRNITRRIRTIWEDEPTAYPRSEVFRNAFSGWVEGGRYLLLHDLYDIWCLDLLGKQPPINLTNGFGRKHKIMFRLVKNVEISRISLKSEIILSAFDQLTKDNGFYRIQFGKTFTPELLCMGAYFFEAPIGEVADYNFAPLKAKESEIYIVRRMSATDAPNFFSTKDFKTFTRLSNVQPAKKHIWYTTELFNYKGLNGAYLQGLLYKPENFDPRKKYPIIFYYYERLSDRKNIYLQPEYASGPIDIPTYVSNGYLVVTPDIDYLIGDPGKSAFNSIVAVARHIKQRRYVDNTHMGIQGHSFGGYETNFLVTHTHLFAAACTSSGIADLASGSGAISAFYGHSWQGFYEAAQMRLGTSIGNRPDIYIKNSPIYYIKNVNTPLLIMHTTHDDIYPFSNAIEFFTALRREGKKVWMLQYDASHALDDVTLAKDYTRRQQEFFDHYLKKKPAPGWMTGAN